MIYDGSDKLLYAFDAKTVQILWSTSTGGSVNSSAAIASGVVYVVADFSRLYAFDATRGKTLWRAEIGYSQQSSPVVAGGVVYASGGNLYAFNATSGKTLWTNPIFSPISSPAVANGL